MIDESLYEVDKNTYKTFVKQIKKGCGKALEEQRDNCVVYKIISKKDSTLWCMRMAFNEDGIKEKYYIFDFPSAEESQRYVPKPQIVLETPEQVQKFFDCLAKEQKNRND